MNFKLKNQKNKEEEKRFEEMKETIYGRKQIKKKNKTEERLILKGTIITAGEDRKYKITENGYLVSENGICQGVFQKLPEKYETWKVEDHGEYLIIPGMTDLHIHAPQYGFRGFGMDLKLLEWLNTYTFPEEAKYREIDYAKKAYEIFTGDLKRSPTTRACIFATIHEEATYLLMDLLEESGLITYTGRVNMDRNSPDILREENAEESLKTTLRWIYNCQKYYQRTYPILTPRFIPSCSDELMKGLGKIAEKMHLPVQSHLSENQEEISWVKELCPKVDCYGEAYEQFGLFGSNGAAIMAHCVHSGKRERELMKKRGTFIAHCPSSNVNLCSGIAPVRTYLEENQKIGLGTDVAAGASLSMFRAMTDAIQVSKLYYCYIDQEKAPLTMEEAFYLATRGGGGFFGKTGYFEKGCELDALVLSEHKIPHPQTLQPEERLERIFYLGDDEAVMHKYVKGCKLF